MTDNCDALAYPTYALAYPTQSHFCFARFRNLIPAVFIEMEQRILMDLLEE